MSTQNADENSVENARVVFQQYWSHARHVENQRLWLTNLFIIIFAGFLGSIAVIQKVSFYISLGGFAFSLIGLFTVHATRVPIVRFSRMAEIIMVTKLGMEKYKRFFIGDRGKSWTVHKTFIIFYCLAGAGWLCLFLYPFIHLKIILAVIFVLVAVGLYKGYGACFGRKESEVEKQLNQLLKERF